MSKHVVRALLLWLCFACAVTPNGVRSPEAAAQATTSGEWLAAARHEVDLTRSGDTIRAGMLAALEGATVVGIGEASHGTHEDVLMKSQIVLELFDADRIDTLYLEANREGVEQLARVLSDREADVREAVRVAAIFRVLKTEAFVHCIEGLRERALRGREVRIVGIDCQATSADANLALEWLAEREPKHAAELRAALEPIVGASALALRQPALISSLDTAKLDACVTQLEVLEQACAADRRVQNAAHRAIQGLLAFRFEVADGDSSEMDPDYFSLRDRFMAENVLADGPHRGAFWGHNLHVLGGLPRGNLEGFRPSGSFLRDELGERYRVVLFDYTRAEIRGVPYAADGNMPDATAATSVFSRAPLDQGLARQIVDSTLKSAWVDLHAMPNAPAFADWRARSWAMEWPGYALSADRDDESVVLMPMEQLCDVLVVLAELGPSRPLD
jgi:erythromycin esterase